MFVTDFVKKSFVGDAVLREYRGIKNTPLKGPKPEISGGVFIFLRFRAQKKARGVYFSEIFGIWAWVLLVNLSTFLTWFLLVNLIKNAQKFRRSAPNWAGGFIFIENLQNFGRGFLIEGGYF